MEEVSCLGKRHTFFLLPLIYIFFLVGCGGGGADEENYPPAFMIGMDEVENCDANAYDGQLRFFTCFLRARDPNEDDDLLYQITGGEDAGFFEITRASALFTLKFKERADYEAFADADGDNIYLFELQVSDGEFTDSVTFRVTLEDAIELRVITGSPERGNGFWDRNSNFEWDFGEPHTHSATSDTLDVAGIGYHSLPATCEPDCVGSVVFPGSQVYGIPADGELVIVSPLSSLVVEANNAEQMLAGLDIEATEEQIHFLDPWEGALEGDALARTLLQWNQQLDFLFSVVFTLGVQPPIPPSDVAASGDASLNPLIFERARGVYASLAQLAEDSVLDGDDPVSLDSISTISHLFESFALREEISEFERDYVAVAAAGVISVNMQADVELSDSSGSYFNSSEFFMALYDLSRETIDIQTFAERTTPSVLFGTEFPGLDLPDVIPPKLISLSRVNNFPDASYLSYSIADDDSGITEVEGVLSNQACELRFSRTYSSSLSVPLQVSDSISLAIGSSTKSGNLSLDSLDLTDADGNTFDGLKLYGSSVSFVIDNPVGDTEPAELISYSLSLDPLNPTIVVVESVIAEAVSISTGSLEGVNDTVDIEVQLEDVFNSRTVSARVQAADLIDNGEGTYTATAYVDLDSEQAANDAELANFRMCDAGLNLTELDKEALEAL